MPGGQKMAQPSQFISKSSSFSSKAPLEEKFVHIYKEIFSGCSPIHAKKASGLQGHAVATRFWDELLLLKVNQQFLIQCLANIDEIQSKTGTKLVLNELFGTCSLYLDDENFIRVAHSLETLIILFQEICKKRFTEQGLTIISLIAGSVEHADLFFTRLLGRVASLLQRDDVPIPVKSLCLRLYLTILTTTDNVNTNVIASYFFQINIFTAILAAMSVKLMEDRRVLELDATLVLILLLLWREGRNIYVEMLSSSATSVIPLFQVSNSLIMHGQAVYEPSLPESSLQQAWSMKNSVYDFLGTYFGFNLTSNDEHKENIITTVLSSRDEYWLCTTAGTVLSYFVVYHYPLMKSTQFWPSTQEVFSWGSSLAQSLSLSWLSLLRSFIFMSGKRLGHLSNVETKEILQAKCCLNLLRCLVESRQALEFLAFSDINDFMVKDVPQGTPGTAHGIPPGRTLCVILDNIVSILLTNPTSFMDPDLFHRVVLLVPIVFNSLKQRGWQLLEQSIGWLHLWNGLMQVTRWIGNKSNLQRPGGREFAELVVGVLEFFLGSSQEFCSAPVVSESLHATVMANMAFLEALMEAATSSANISMEPVNILAVKLHYEIQIAALGVRGCPTYEQAFRAVQKKGMLSLKLRAKYAGQTHAYVEGTAELGLLVNITRSLVTLHHKQTSMRQPKLELSVRGSHSNV